MIVSRAYLLLQVGDLLERLIDLAADILQGVLANYFTLDLFFHFLKLGLVGGQGVVWLNLGNAVVH